MKNYFKIVKYMFSVGKKLIPGAFLVLLAVIALQTAIPIGINKVLSSVEENRDLRTFLLGLAGFFVAYIILSFLTEANTELFIGIGNRLLWAMREKIYRVLWKSDYMTEVQKNKDRFKFVLTTQTYKAFAIAVIYTLGGIANALTVLALWAVAFYISVPVGMVLVISVLITTLVTFFTGKTILDNYEKSNEAQEKDNAQIIETVDLCEAARTNNLEEYYLGKNKEVHSIFMELSQKAEGKSAFCEALEIGLHSIIYIVAAGVLFLSGKTDAGAIVAILFIANLTIEVSGRLQRQIQVIIKNIPAFNDVVELMEVPIHDGTKLQKVENISLSDVGFSVDGRNVFAGIKEQIKKGDNVLIKGENGSGKSSLLKILLGLYRPTEGKVLVNGKNIEEYNYLTFCDEICYISQEELLLNESVEDYLRIITHTDIKNDFISELREKVKLNSEIKEITENGATLSGGEKKKMFMMKCLLKTDASVVILDEIDAGLDGDTKLTLKEIENQLKKDKNKTLFKISHIDSDTEGYDIVINL
ncbi:MAG: ABC transporter ATP-binding protein [Lachnospiraceae bacterium]|nr:ABC transporter ATP-binding protein [Lachnospiraceae bacterium]